MLGMPRQMFEEVRRYLLSEEGKNQEAGGFFGNEQGQHWIASGEFNVLSSVGCQQLAQSLSAPPL